MKQVSGHYQAILPPKFDTFTSKNIIDIEKLITILFDHDYNLSKIKRFLVVNMNSDIEDEGDYNVEDDELNLTWGTVEFSKKPHLFPTSPCDRWGGIINYKGKEFYLSFDENDMLNVGYNNINYVFNNPTITEDCLEVYEMIFEGVVPNEFISM